MDKNVARNLLDTITCQERALIFPAFSSEDAYKIGLAIKNMADEIDRKVVISISKGESSLFFYAMDSIKPININWLERKIRTTNMYHCSSFSVGLRQICSDNTFADSGLDPALYAGVGGCFPIVVRNCGFIGTIAVSGMEQHQDHQAVVDAVGKYLGIETGSVLDYFEH